MADESVAAAVVKEVEGYPYFIQLWESELWDAADLAGVDRLTPELLDEARPEIYQRLEWIHGTEIPRFPTAASSRLTSRNTTV